MLAAAAAALIAFTAQNSGTTATLRGIAAVDERVAWATGAGGAVLRTTDGGAHWQPLTIPDSASLDFRDVHAESANIAYVLAAGPGPQGKLFKTADGGKTWTLLLTNPDSNGFLDAIAFWDVNNGLILGDPVDGQFVILRTADAGRTWERLPTPPSLPGEGAFAASGTCLITRGANEAWFATGGPAGARIFHTKDRGETWTVHTTPIRDGIYSLAIEGRLAIAVGGSHDQPEDPETLAATSTRAGRKWTTITRPGGYRSAAAIHGGTIVAVGSHASSYSTDAGNTWQPLPDAAYHAIAITRRGHGWAVGAKGRIARVRVP